MLKWINLIKKSNGRIRKKNIQIKHYKTSLSKQHIIPSLKNILQSPPWRGISIHPSSLTTIKTARSKPITKKQHYIFIRLNHVSRNTFYRVHSAKRFYNQEQCFKIELATLATIFPKLSHSLIYQCFTLISFISFNKNTCWRRWHSFQRMPIYSCSNNDKCFCLKYELLF